MTERPMTTPPDPQDTALGQALAAMQAAPDDDAARLRFYARLADAELFLLTEVEASGGRIDPVIGEAGGQPMVLAFDREEGLADFAGGAAPYVALSGRALAGMLAGAGAGAGAEAADVPAGEAAELGAAGAPDAVQKSASGDTGTGPVTGIGIGLNFDRPEAAFVLPPAAVAWLAGMLAEVPGELDRRPVALHSPSDLPPGLLAALDTALAGAAGLAVSAALARAEYDSGDAGLLLAFEGTREGAERALAAACREALVFSGLEEAALDVVFLPPSAPLLARLERVALRLDLPAPRHAPARPAAPAAPGSDPAKPPRLR